MPNNNQLPSLLLAGTIGGLLGCLGTSLLQPAAPVQSAATTQTIGASPELGGLQQDLRALVKALKARPMTLPPAAATSVRTPVGQSNGDVLTALASLEEAIRQMAAPRALAATSTTEAAPLHFGTPPPRNHAACLLSSQEIDKDEDLALPKYFGMSMSQVYQRFGPPNYASPTKTSIHWKYESPDDEYDLTFVFHDGLVINIWA